METFSHLVDIFLHIDIYLASLIATYGLWVYLLLFLTIFFETGIVIAPLPGDSLLFTAGAMAVISGLDIKILLIILPIASILGDNTNYFIGKTMGSCLVKEDDSGLVKKARINQTAEFYAKYGSYAIIMARFAPVLRSIAPFFAGFSRFDRKTFLTFDIIGSIVWTTSFILSGYLLGNIPFIKENFSWFVVGIILVSFSPAIIGYFKNKK